MMPRHLTIEATRDDFTKIIESLADSDEPVIVEGDGKPRAVLVSPTLYARLTNQDELARAWETVDSIRERLSHIPVEEIDNDIDEMVKEIRRERNASADSLSR